MQMLYPSSDIRENAFTPPSGDVLKCVDFLAESLTAAVSVNPDAPVKDPPLPPNEPPIKEPDTPPKGPFPPRHPPVEEPPDAPRKSPVGDPPTDDLDRTPAHQS